MSGARIIVKVPATSANLGPGFDTLGLALELFTTIELEYADQTHIDVIGQHLQHISTKKSNLVYRSIQTVFEKVGVPVPGLHLSIYSEIPLARGLGSSAAAIIGGMTAANALLDHALSQEQIFALATKMEGHPDNVGAALFGGLIISLMDGQEPHYIKLLPPDDLEIMLIIPEYELSTKLSRQVLPAQVSLEDAVYNVSHSSLFVAAWASGQLDKLQIAMQDRLHQPYRSSLVPGMTKTLQEATSYGALGVALSGAGPTLIAFVDQKQQRNEELEDYLQQTLKENGVSISYKWVKASQHGAVLV